MPRSPPPTSHQLPLFNAVLSSVYSSDNAGFEGSRCIDGVLTDAPGGTHDHNLCMSQVGKPNPWLSVSTLTPSSFEKVTVHVPTSCCFTLLARFEVWVSDMAGAPHSHKSTKCGAMVVHGSAKGRSFTISCSGLVGSVVTLLLPGAARTLAVAELEVFGYAIATAPSLLLPPSPPALLATRAPPPNPPTGLIPPPSITSMHKLPLLNAKMSSVYPSNDGLYDGFHCIDGQTHDSSAGPHNHNLCMTQLHKPNPWLSVSAPSRSHIEKVIVHVPTSCCFTLLARFEVWVSDMAGAPHSHKSTKCGAMVVHGSAKGRSFTISCSGLVGSVVTLLLPGAARTLAVAELEVFGWVTALDVPDVATSTFLPPPPPISLNPADGLNGSNVLAAPAAAPVMSPPMQAPRPPLPLAPMRTTLQTDNLPLIKAAMSSVYPSHGTFDASQCIDGFLTSATSRSDDHNLCMSQIGVPNPWLSVSTRQHSVFDKVVVHVPTSCCFALLSEFEVWVSDVEGYPTQQNATKCGGMTAPAGKGRSFIISCSGLVGSVVTLLLPGRARTLAVAELEALGTAAPSLLSTPTTTTSGATALASPPHPMHSSPQPSQSPTPLPSATPTPHDTPSATGSPAVTHGRPLSEPAAEAEGDSMLAPLLVLTLIGLAAGFTSGFAIVIYRRRKADQGGGFLMPFGMQHGLSPRPASRRRHRTAPEGGAAEAAISRWHSALSLVRKASTSTHPTTETARGAESGFLVPFSHVGSAAESATGGGWRALVPSRRLRPPRHRAPPRCRGWSLGQPSGGGSA